MTPDAHAQVLEPWRGSWRGVLIVVAVTLAALLPFIDKAFHIDDPMYLWAAKHIAVDPWNFYGFDAHWALAAGPMPDNMKNPPGVSYYLAAAASILGWSERAMHVALLLPAVGAVLGVYVLAGWWCSRPLAATLAFVMTPAFLVCASAVMCDVLMLCFWMWAMVLWECGLRRRSNLLLLVAALLIAAAMFSKYFGIALIPLLLAYGLLRTRRVGVWIVWLAVPLLALALYEWWTARLYGRGLFVDAMGYSADYQQTVGRRWYDQIAVGLAFLGGSSTALLFVAPRLWSWKAIAVGIVAGAAFIWALVSMGEWAHTPMAGDAGPRWWLLVQAALMFVTGCSVWPLAATDAWRRRTPEAIVLVLWVAGTFVFSSALNWSVTVRTMLPAVPAVMILIMRRLEDRSAAPSRNIEWSTVVALTITGVVGMLVMWGDYCLANSAREAAARIMGQPRAPFTKVWFFGHWGFQYYMEAQGARPVDVLKRELDVADIVVAPMNNFRMEGLEAFDHGYSRMSIPLNAWATLVSRPQGAGFYSSSGGPLPFVIGPAPDEVYELFIVQMPPAATER